MGSEERVTLDDFSNGEVNGELLDNKPLDEEPKKEKQRGNKKLVPKKHLGKPAEETKKLKPKPPRKRIIKKRGYKIIKQEKFSI